MKKKPRVSSIPGPDGRKPAGHQLAGHRPSGHRPSARKPAILLAGYFGYSNLGDELILQEAVRALRPLDRPLWILSGPKPADFGRGARSVRRGDLLRLSRLLLSPGLDVVFPGGEIFQSASSRRSLYFYVFLCRLAVGLGRRLFLLFQGVPDRSLAPSDLRAVESVFRSAAFVSFRDRVPAFAAGIAASLHSSPFAALPDPVFGMEPPARRRHAGVVVFVLKSRGRKDRGWIAVILGLIASILEERPGVRVRLAAFHPADRKFNLRLLEEAGNGRVSLERTGLEGLKNLAGKADFVFSDRYHGLVLAALSGVCAFSLGDSGKIRDLRGFLSPGSFPDSAAGCGTETVLKSALWAFRSATPARIPSARLAKKVRDHWARVRRELETEP